MVHFYRNVFSHVPATKVREVSHILKAIHAQENREAADRKARAVVRSTHRQDEHGGRSCSTQRPRDAGLLLLPGHPLAEDPHQPPLERIMREIRRRTRVVGAFPDCQSCNLAAARLRHIAGTTWSAKCYMNMRPLYQPQIMQTGAVA